MKTRLIPRALAALLFLLAGAVVADTITLEADRDNTMYEPLDKDGGPKAGAGGNLNSNGAGDFFFAGTNSGEVDGQEFYTIRRGLTHFDVVGELPPGAIVTNVQIQFELSRSAGGPESVSLHRALSDWGEGTSDAPGGEGSGAPAEAGDATWEHTFFPNSFWGSTGGDFVVAPSASQTVGTTLGPYTWGSTAEMVADVQLWLDDPSQNFGYVVLGNEQTAQTAKRFNTREHPGEAVGAMLIVEYTPAVPTTPGWALVLLAVILTAGGLSLHGVRHPGQASAR